MVENKLNTGAVSEFIFAYSIEYSGADNVVIKKYTTNGVESYASYVQINSVLSGSHTDPGIA